MRNCQDNNNSISISHTSPQITVLEREKKKGSVEGSVVAEPSKERETPIRPKSDEGQILYKVTTHVSVSISVID